MVDWSGRFPNHVRISTWFLYTIEPRVRTFDTASVEIFSHASYFFIYLTVNKKQVLADTFCCLCIFRCYNLPTTNSHFKDKFKEK